MADLIIAPTIAFSKKRPTESIVDAVNPYSSEDIILKEKIVPMTVQRPSNVPRKLQNKRTANLQAIKDGSEDIDSINRQRAEYEQITAKKNMTYFPDTGIIGVNKIVGGTIDGSIG